MSDPNVVQNPDALHCVKSIQIRSFFWLNAGKYESEKTPYLDTYHAVLLLDTWPKLNLGSWKAVLNVSWTFYVQIFFEVLICDLSYVSALFQPITGYCSISIPLSTSENLIFWSFQGVQKLNIGFKWVTLFLLLRLL